MLYQESKVIENKKLSRFSLSEIFFFIFVANFFRNLAKTNLSQVNEKAEHTINP